MAVDTSAWAVGRWCFQDESERKETSILAIADTKPAVSLWHGDDISGDFP